MIRAIVMVVAALMAVACSGPQPAAESGPFIGINGKPLKTAEGNTDNSVQEALTADPAACAKVGGVVQPVCMMQRPMCVIAFRDAGKACSGSADCSGRCEAASGTPMNQKTTGKCSQTNNPCGCFQLVENGAALPVLCAD